MQKVTPFEWNAAISNERKLSALGKQPAYRAKKMELVLVKQAPLEHIVLRSHVFAIAPSFCQPAGRRNALSRRACEANETHENALFRR